MHKVRVGILGGSGLYNIQGLEKIQEHKINTPYGLPSDTIITGMIGKTSVAFLARHGRGHSLLPSEVPYRANIYALKRLGVRYLVSVSAVGSLREEMRPRDMVLADQYLDMTKNRYNTFFGDDLIAHVSMAKPTCEILNSLLAEVGHEVLENNPEFSSENEEKKRIHGKACYVCIEGPQFSTLAESKLYQSFGADIIGMTNMPEAKLAREAQIAYASLCMVTDYDCWHPKEKAVTADIAIRNLKANSQFAQEIILRFCQKLEGLNDHALQSEAHRALLRGLVSSPETLNMEKKAILEVLLG